MKLKWKKEWDNKRKYIHKNYYVVFIKSNHLDLYTVVSYGRKSQLKSLQIQPLNNFLKL